MRKEQIVRLPTSEIIFLAQGRLRQTLRGQKFARYLHELPMQRIFG